MDYGYLYIFIVLALFYYLIRRVVLPKAVNEEVDIVMQCELEQMKIIFSQEVENLHQEMAILFDDLKHQEVDNLKQSFKQEIELYKRQLAIENKKSMAMYEDQCRSCKDIMAAMHAVIQVIERNDGERLFGYINRDEYQTFAQVAQRESIYISDQVRRWLHIFSEILSEIVKGEFDEAEDQGMDIYVGIRYKQLNFIKEYIANYFGEELGIATSTESLDDIEVLNACRLVSTYYHRDWLPKINEKFRSTKEKSPYQLVKEAKTDLKELKQTLVDLQEYLIHEERRFWYEKQFAVERSLYYIEKIVIPTRRNLSNRERL